MDAFVAYSLPIQGLKSGENRFEYEIDSEFFKNFEDSPVGEAQIKFEILLDKRPDLLILDFALKGHVGVECDRCTAPINLPLEGERQLMVKFGEQEEEEDEVVYLPDWNATFNLAKYLYEFTVLSLPIINRYDCKSDPKPPCNFDVLQYLKTEEDEDTQADNPVWDVLKKINKN